MSYRDTIHDAINAEKGDVQAADRLALSEWAEKRRSSHLGMTAQTVARNHLFHVSDIAHDLRAVFSIKPSDERAIADRARWIERHARELLAAIGEAGA